MSEPGGYVYAIRCADFIKIGFSKKPVRRARGLSTATPLKTELLGFMPGTMADEAELHRRFAAHRHRAEWFRADESVLAFVKTLKRPRDFLWMDKRRAKKTPEQIEAQKVASRRAAINRDAEREYRARLNMGLL